MFFIFYAHILKNEFFYLRLQQYSKETIMEKNNENNLITPESVLAAVKEMIAASSRASREEFNLYLKQSQETFDLRMKQSQEIFDLRMKKQDKKNKDFERLMKKSKEEQDKRSAALDLKLDRLTEQVSGITKSNGLFTEYHKKSKEEQDKRSAALDLKLDRLTEQVSGITKSNGLFAEDYFLSSFTKDDLNFFGEQFDKVIRGKGTKAQDEYDFVVINGKTAGIVEVKYKARNDDIEKALKKVVTFRINFPEYSNHKIYLAIAALSIDERLERECHKQGIAVIKQIGDKVVIYDKNLKAF